MSHFSRITAEIKDIEALKRACSKMGFPIEDWALCRHYFGKTLKEKVIKLPGDYDIAVKTEGDHFILEADLYSGQVAKYVGADAKDLMLNYSKEKIESEAMHFGLFVQENSNNSIEMTDPDTGGKIRVDFDENNNISFQYSGFGEQCLKFKKLEETLGILKEFTYTDEFYEEQESTDKVVLKQ